MGWWRTFVRKRTRPINPERAIKIRNLLSGLYFFSAWNALSYGIYICVKKSAPETEIEKENPGKYYARLLGTGNAKVFKFQGFTLTDEYEIEGTKRPAPDRARIEKELEWMVQQSEKKSPDEDLELLVEETSSL